MNNDDKSAYKLIGEYRILREIFIFRDSMHTKKTAMQNFERIYNQLEEVLPKYLEGVDKAKAHLKKIESPLYKILND